MVPALLAGNTVVLKPSPLTPLTVLKIAELMVDLLPPGVLNVISGGDSLGTPSAPGYFVPVTLFDNPPDTTELAAEEPFGPVLPLLRFDTVEEVVARANASPYGLAGSVWSRDANAALAVASQTGDGHRVRQRALLPVSVCGFRRAQAIGYRHRERIGWIAELNGPQTVMWRRS